MALLTKPTDKPEWASGVGAAISSPPTPKRQQGWIVEKPPHQYQNWMMNLLYLWLLYFENRIDSLQNNYDMVVKAGATGTHADLVTALSAAVAGTRILVCENQTINTTALVVDKAVEIQLKPGVSILKGTSVTGISVTSTGSGARIKGGKITGFTTAIAINASADRVKVGEVDFSGNTNDVDDQNGNAAIYGCHFS